jgi:hypothetical protein
VPFNAQTRRSETLTNQRSVRSPRAAQPRLGLRHILPLFSNGSVRARPLSQMTHAFSAVFFRRLSRELHRSISFKVAWPVMAAISCGTIFLEHSQMRCPCPVPLAVQPAWCVAWQEILAALKMPFSRPSVA